MKLSNQIKPISYLKSSAAEIIRNIGEQSDPLIITQNGEAKAIIQSIQSYEQSKDILVSLSPITIQFRLNFNLSILCQKIVCYPVPPIP